MHLSIARHLGCIHIIQLFSELAQSCPILCNPIDWGPPGSSVHGISQARTQEWVAIPFSIYSYQQSIKWCVNSIVQFSSVTQSCPTLCDPMNCNTPGFPVHHQLPEFTQTHVHRVGDAIQPSHPLSSPFSPAPIPPSNKNQGNRIPNVTNLCLSEAL